MHNTRDGIWCLIAAVGFAAWWVRVFFGKGTERDIESQVRAARFIQARPVLRRLLSWLEMPPKDHRRYIRRWKLFASLFFLPTAIMYGWWGIGLVVRR